LGRCSDTGQIALPSSKERALLAHLVARASRTVSTDELIETLWGEAPPRTAAKALQNHVLRLRNVLEPDRDGSPVLLVTDGSGYRLNVADDAIDARRFERLVSLEDRIAADLDLGRARETVGELESLVHEHPLRERFWHVLILALYRSDRQADALAAYSRARDVLVEGAWRRAKW
jgi:DNA-binding SARP family transcriptional activator